MAPRAGSRRRFYTPREVRASYDAAKARDEARGELPAYLLYRPLSFLVTPLFLVLGLGPNQVTLLAALLPLTMLGAVWHGGEGAWVWVTGLGLTFHVLDCVDGNVARVTGCSSQRGALLDGVADVLFWLCLFLSLGLLVEAQGGGLLGSWGLELALLLPVLVLWNHRVRAQLAELEPPRAEGPAAWIPAGSFEVLFGGLENLYVFAIAAGGLTRRQDLVLIGVAAYVVGVWAYVLGSSLARAGSLDAPASAPPESAEARDVS